MPFAKPDTVVLLTIGQISDILDDELGNTRRSRVEVDSQGDVVFLPPYHQDPDGDAIETHLLPGLKARILAAIEAEASETI